MRLGLILLFGAGAYWTVAISVLMATVMFNKRIFAYLGGSPDPGGDVGAPFLYLIVLIAEVCSFLLWALGLGLLTHRSFGRNPNVVWGTLLLCGVSALDTVMLADYMRHTIDSAAQRGSEPRELGVAIGMLGSGIFVLVVLQTFRS